MCQLFTGHMHLLWSLYNSDMYLHIYLDPVKKEAKILVSTFRIEKCLLWLLNPILFF